MKKYLSHFTAAYYWNIPHLDNVFNAKYINRSESDEVTDMTVTGQSERYQEKNHIIHVNELPLPRGAVIKKGDIFVASPELVFLELANLLDIHRLILLGLQMCSHPPGKGFVAVTTKRKLLAFVDKTKGHKGHRKAERAMQYVEDGSASLMESIAFMILTLPYLHGGFGLKGACFNQKIELRDNDRRSLKQKQFYVDLFYAKSKLAIEYDSFSYHNSPSAQSKDLLRAAALEHQGIDVIRISTIQLYNDEACKEFAQNLAGRLGKRIRIRTENFDRAHNDIRNLLPSQE